MIKYYVDTSVWRDYFEDRSDGLKPLGEFAFQFLRKCIERNDVIIVSNEVAKELLRYYSKDKIEEMFSYFTDIIVEIKYNEAQVAEALSFWIKTNKKFPLSDIIHSILARDNKAVLISRDAHFEKIGIAKCKFPEEIN